jgi:hypothetical protein
VDFSIFKVSDEDDNDNDNKNTIYIYIYMDDVGLIGERGGKSLPTFLFTSLLPCSRSITYLRYLTSPPSLNSRFGDLYETLTRYIMRMILSLPVYHEDDTLTIYHVRTGCILTNFT